MKNRRNGFTLLELLVIIAIITFLAGMVFPTLGKARTRARKAKAISELKTIELALMDYYTEYSTFPMNSYPTVEKGLYKLAEEGYLDTALKDAFDSDNIYRYYSCNDSGTVADSCIVFSVGPNRIDDGATDFDKAYADAYPLGLGGPGPLSDNIYLILLPVEDIRYKK